MSDPVARQARYVAAAFRDKGLPDVAEMIDYLADAADKWWDHCTPPHDPRVAGPGDPADEYADTTSPA